MKGILFIEYLYNRNRQGFKNQTRRSGGLDAVNGNKKKGIITNPDDWNLGLKSVANLDCKQTTISFENKKTRELVICKPRYKVGDVVYIKEPTIKLYKDPNNKEYIYRYGSGSDSCFVTRDGYTGHSENFENLKWSNKLYMGEGQAREYIKIVGLRVERLHDISDADCIGEGIEEHPRALFESYRFRNYSEDCLPIKAKDSFFSLFKLANKKKEVPNLWVFVYDYVRVNKKGELL